MWKQTREHFFHTQVMGINCLYKIPRYIPDVCALENAQLFTGHYSLMPYKKIPKMQKLSKNSNGKWVQYPSQIGL